MQKTAIGNNIKNRPEFPAKNWPENVYRQIEEFNEFSQIVMQRTKN